MGRPVSHTNVHPWDCTTLRGYTTAMPFPRIYNGRTIGERPATPSATLQDSPIPNDGHEPLRRDHARHIPQDLPLLRPRPQGSGPPVGHHHRHALPRRELKRLLWQGVLHSGGPAGHQPRRGLRVLPVRVGVCHTPVGKRGGREEAH